MPITSKLEKIMKYYHDLFMSEELLPNKKKIIHKLEKNKVQIEKYLVVLPKGSRNHLEIYNSVYLIQNVFDKDEMFIVGITKDRQDAMQLVEKITQEVYDETSGVDIRNYILQKQQKYEEGNV